jgi:citrate lyase subunit beta/citryl-CoA lyase
MLRSFLFAPVTNARHVAKAIEGPADAVILDLEDAVAVEEKPAARVLVTEILAKPRRKPLYVRINALSTRFSFDDLHAVGSAAPDGIMLPKVESAATLLTVDWILGEIEVRHGQARGAIDLIPIIETAKGLAAVGSIAGAVARAHRLSLGVVDLSLDMDLDGSDETAALHQPRFAIALASRASGMWGPLDTAFINIPDLAGLRASTIAAKKMGYTGKACIHPTQVEVVNAVFEPTAEDIARARRIVAAFAEAERAGAAAVKIDGVMVDYPVYDKARRLLSDLPGGAADGTAQ